jgi:hypothetical protein
MRVSVGKITETYSMCKEAEHKVPERYNAYTFLTLSTDKLNSVQRYDTAQNYKILHKVVKRLFQRNLQISHRLHT